MQHVQTGQVAQPEKQENGAECETQFEASDTSPLPAWAGIFHGRWLTILEVRMVFV